MMWILSSIDFDTLRTADAYLQPNKSSSWFVFKLLSAMFQQVSYYSYHNIINISCLDEI